MSENRIVVGGFSFENGSEAEQAAKEAEGVKYIKTKTNMDDPEAVLKIYNRIIQQNMFETAVGFSYLYDLREYLLSIPFIRKEDVLPIRVVHPALMRDLRSVLRTNVKDSIKKEKEVSVNGDYKQKFHIMRIIAVILAVCVAGMLLITLTVGHPNILNYENKLIDKYEVWEQELNEREAVLKEKEKQLGIS